MAVGSRPRPPGGPRRRTAALLACSLMLGLLAACQHGTGPPGHARPQARSVVVASFNFPESEVLAAIYGLALRHAG